MYQDVKTYRNSAIMLYTFLHLGIKWKRDVAYLQPKEKYPLSTGQMPVNVFQKSIPGLNYT